MDGWLKVLINICAMFFVILVGWVARRRNFLTEETTGSLSRFVIDVTIPALVLTQLLYTVDSNTLRQSWLVPLLGGVILVISGGVALLTMPFFTRREQRPTFIFLVAISNWVYLPLPIAEALYGADGVRAVLLSNVGAQLVLWTLGVWTLRGGKPDMHSLKHLVTNPGLIATAIGILLTLYVPGANTWITGAIPDSINPLLKAMLMVGNLTIPLSLIVTGAQLGGLDLSDHRPSWTLTGVLITRLAIAPAVIIALIWLGVHLGLPLPEEARMVAYLIAAMPVAISCSIFTARFGGDTSLAARSIFATTLFSIATVPFIFYLIQEWRL